MTNKKNQIIAIIALLCIVVSIIGTGILFLFSGGGEIEPTELTPEQLEQIKQLIESQSGTVSGTGAGEDIITDDITIEDINGNEENVEELNNNNL